MTTETTKLKTEASKVEAKTELSPEERAELRQSKKDALRRAIQDRKLLSLSDKQMEELHKRGKVPQLVNAELIELYRSRGFEILQNAEHQSSDPLYQKSGSSLEVQVSRSDPTRKAYWMVTDIENYQLLEELREEDALRIDAQIKNPKTVDIKGGNIRKV